MKVDVLNMQGEKVSTVELPAAIFEAPIKPDLMHQAFVRQMANARLGTHKTKTPRRSRRRRAQAVEARRAPAAPARARPRSPQWVGGGKVHTPQPRDYTLRMPRKMRRAALRSALSAKAAEAEIVVVDELSLARAEDRRDGQGAAAAWSGTAATLIVLPGKPTSRSSGRCATWRRPRSCGRSYLNIRDLLGYDKVDPAAGCAGSDPVVPGRGGGQR